MGSTTKYRLFSSGQELHHPAVGHGAEPYHGEAAEPDPNQEPTL
jgi:hypothetical protein